MAEIALSRLYLRMCNGYLEDHANVLCMLSRIMICISHCPAQQHCLRYEVMPWGLIACNQRRCAKIASNRAVAALLQQPRLLLVQSMRQLASSSPAACSQSRLDRDCRSSLAYSRRQVRRRPTPVEVAAAIAHQDSGQGILSEDSDEQLLQQQRLQEEEEAKYLEPLDPFKPLIVKAVADGIRPRRTRLGVLQSVPMVAPANEHLASALKRASKVTYAAHIKNEAEKERNRAARQMDTLMKELSVPMSKYVSGFPDPSKLHPFDRALLQLTVSEVTYRSVLAKVDSLRKSIQESGKAYAKRAANASNKQAALTVALEGCEALERIFRNGSKIVDDLKEIAKKLRALPSLELDLPTLALVGAPNVGKSSLVQVLSSGTPEICNYPFTTRSIQMGHFFLDSRKHQVTDTPGLLSRPDEERNTMEMLTLAALDCLPTSVLFVMDLTEECGTSVQDQWAIRSEVKERFPDKPWIDVFSKADLVQDIYEQAQKHIDSNAEQISSDHTLTPVELASRLPGALYVSSTTREGINALQHNIIAMFQKQLQEQQLARLSDSRPFDLQALPDS